MKERPKIVIDFNPDHSVTWNSCGWGTDHSLMAKAKESINRGHDPKEVIELLNEAGFDVVMITDSTSEH